MPATLKELKETLAELPPSQRAELAEYLIHSLPDSDTEEKPAGGRAFLNAFVRGMGSALEFFPPAERLDRWRLAEDVPLNEWPDTVRGLLAELREHDDHPGAGT